MENPVLIDLSNNTTSDIAKMDKFLPKELQMPVGIAIVVLVIAIIFGLKKTSSKDEAKEVQFEASFKSPVKPDSVSKAGTPINEKTGTVMTPAGRRSARLARRKED